MGDLRGIRTSRPAARLSARAVFCCCAWLGAVAAPAVAQEAVEPGPGGIRLLKGVEWHQNWQPSAAAPCPSPRIVELKGACLGDSPAPPQRAPAAQALAPSLDLTPTEYVRPADVWAELFQVDELVKVAPAGDGPAGGNEASEIHLAPGDEGTAERQVVQAARREEETAAPAPAASPAVSSGEPAPRIQAAAEGSLYQAALVHFVSTAAAVVVALGVFCAGLVLLRRLGVSLPIGWQPPAPDWGAAPLPVAPPPAESVPEVVPEEGAAPAFDLGPTYAEEARQREQAAREQEEAMLRHLFEQNVRLREQIGELAGAGESAAPPGE